MTDSNESPRARARAHLRQMLQAASLAAVAGCGDDGSTSDSGPTTGATTWEDPCAEDGCDPPPPPETSTGPMPMTGTETEGLDTGSGTEGESSSGTGGESSSGTDTGSGSGTGTGSSG